MRAWGFGGVEADGGVALLVEARAGEATVAVGGLEAFAGVFGEDERVRGEDLRVGRASQEAERLGVVVLGVVGRVEEDQVERVPELEKPLQERGGSAVFDAIAAGDLEVGQVGFEGFERRRSVLCEEDVRGAARDGFDADGTGSGEEVGEAAARDAGAEDVEEGLAEPVAGGAGVGSGRGGEDSGPVDSGDDAHEPW